mmetsp:Transcript_55120/g.130422  ORF Transcript_55120/g.130422 Transcript_55120/m.130422 type:complete len:574 (-) Transcript_55120:63-1784(-)
MSDDDNGDPTPTSNYFVEPLELSRAVNRTHPRAFKQLPASPSATSEARDFGGRTEGLAVHTASVRFTAANLDHVTADFGVSPVRPQTVNTLSDHPPHAPHASFQAFSSADEQSDGGNGPVSAPPRARGRGAAGDTPPASKIPPPKQQRPLNFVWNVCKNIIHHLFLDRDHDSERALPLFEDVERREGERLFLLRLSSQSRLEVMLVFKGTMLSMVLVDWLTWYNIAIFIAVRMVDSYRPHYLPHIEVKIVGVIGGFLIFFLTFHASECYRRFQRLHNCSATLQQTVDRLALTAKIYFPTPEARRLVRLANGMHAVGYCGLHSAYSASNFVEHLNECYQLFTPAELRRLHVLDIDTGRTAHLEIATWMGEIIWDVEKATKMNAPLVRGLQDTVLKMVELFGEMYEAEAQPVPLIYVNFIYFASFIYLPLFSYSLGVDFGTTIEDFGEQTMGEHFIVLCVHMGIIFLQTFFILGLERLSYELQNCYGDDLQDLCVLTYVQETILRSRRILAAASFSTDAKVEEALWSRIPALGEGFTEGVEESERLRNGEWRQPDAMKIADERKAKCMGCLHTAH